MCPARVDTMRCRSCPKWASMCSRITSVAQRRYLIIRNASLNSNSCKTNLSKSQAPAHTGSHHNSATMTTATCTSDLAACTRRGITSVTIDYQDMFSFGKFVQINIIYLIKLIRSFFKIQFQMTAKNDFIIIFTSIYR